MRTKDFKIKWGMVIDIDKCTGCGACMVACQAENNLAPEAEAPPSDGGDEFMSWIRIYELSNRKAFPHHDLAYLPLPCQHCATPFCTGVCPVSATEKTEEGGIVSQIYARCTGCRYCMAACPYHARSFNRVAPVWPAGLDKIISPDVSTRPRGVVEKCSFCHHRFMQAKNAARNNAHSIYELEDGDYNPACAESCPNGAIAFGDLLNKKHRVYALSRAKNAFRLLERLNAKPQVYYTSSRDWVRRAGDNHHA
ncbi:MAG: 4Fe-4S dicluster domain-containing protein [Deltaproteobacteria bacterium]|nr:4Fe-4S dicluster domain-containing protein [Deltaproteobacteria bacterium]